MAGPSKRKRARVKEETDELPSNSQEFCKHETSAEPPEIPMSRDATFWFGDGNVVLIARDVEFRVYQGLLAAYSPVFKDLFDEEARRTPASSQPGACIIVRVEDSPEDLRHILNAYMRGPQVSPFVAEKFAFGPISAYIRLGLKYSITRIVTHAVTFLKTIFPTSLDDYWFRGNAFALTVQAIGVVNLARLANIPSILPTALLLCARLPGGDLVHGFCREDGSREQLSPDDIALCQDAKSKILGMHISSSSCVFTLASTSAKCDTPKTCAREARSILSCFQERMSTTPMLSPLQPILFLSSPVPPKRMCSYCWTAMKERARESQITAWSNLPSLLDLHIEDWQSSR